MVQIWDTATGWLGRSACVRERAGCTPRFARDGRVQPARRSVSSSPATSSSRPSRSTCTRSGRATAPTAAQQRAMLQRGAFEHARTQRCSGSTQISALPPEAAAPRASRSANAGESSDRRALAFTGGGDVFTRGAKVVVKPGGTSHAGAAASAARTAMTRRSCAPALSSAHSPLAPRRNPEHAGQVRAPRARLRGRLVV